MRFAWVAATCFAIGVGLLPVGATAGDRSEHRAFAQRVELRDTGETRPSRWSPPSGQTVFQPYADSDSPVTARIAFDASDAAGCPEQFFAFHMGRVGIDLSVPPAMGVAMRSTGAQAPQNVHWLTLQSPRCRIAVRVSKAIRTREGDWQRVAVWSQTGGPGPFPVLADTDAIDPDALAVAREGFKKERRAWEKRMSEWTGLRIKAVMDAMHQRDPARAAEIDRRGPRPAEFAHDGYVGRYWFADTPEPCFEASGYLVIGPSGLRLTYRPQLSQAGSQVAPSGSEPLVPFSASVTYDDAGTTGTLAFYDPTCRLEIAVGGDLMTTTGWVPTPVKRTF